MIKYSIGNIEYLFSSLKNGDFLGFYHRPWYFLFSKVIAFFTGGKLDHVAGVLNVGRSDDVVSFDLAEYKSNQGKQITRYFINKNKDTYSIDSRFAKRHINVFYLPNKYTLTKSQNAKLHDFWNAKNTSYSFMQLPLTINCINSIVNFFRRTKKPTKARYCSGVLKESMDYINIKPQKYDDQHPSPIEFVKFSYVDGIVKIRQNKMPNKYTLTKSQNAKLHDFWNAKNTSYSFMQLPLTINCINSIVNFFRRTKKPTKARYCSGVLKESMDYINIKPQKYDDQHPSPIEFVKFSYVDGIVKINGKRELNKRKDTKYLVLIAILLAYIVYNLYPSNANYKYFTSDSEIKNLIDENLAKCGSGYYISWLRFANKYNKANYYFQDVRGCQKNASKNCGYSVKYAKLNPHYANNNLYISSNLYNYLQSLGVDKVGYYTHHELKNNQFSEVRNLLQASNHEIFSAGFVVLKKHKIVKDIFIFTNTNNASLSCNKKQVVQILEDIAHARKQQYKNV